MVDIIDIGCTGCIDAFQAKVDGTCRQRNIYRNGGPGGPVGCSREADTGNEVLPFTNNRDGLSAPPPLE